MIDLIRFANLKVVTKVEKVQGEREEQLGSLSKEDFEGLDVWDTKGFEANNYPLIQILPKYLEYRISHNK